ncbi:Nif3-like dinuclear metal center hexameric protein [Odoribacter lunatus]|uniref:Nif3-like dinuclear metal center hexameric protein n=1 Tax=Odoribacter lunatus TaxID=2941335 RepID=UPI00203F5335|nr:Nif3-like dinuclear metal center hexameric protein [Odoribacter lunatus]
MQVKDLTSIIEQYAPLNLQESYDNAGLICGDTENEVTAVLLCTDVTESVIDEAIAENCNLIISHHPLTIQPLKNLLPHNSIKRSLIKAIKHDINIYAAHTNMDAVINGVSGKIADKLGLTSREILQVSPNSSNTTTGFGIIGELEKAADSYNYLKQIKEIFHCEIIRHTALCTPTVKRIAVCGGSGAFLIKDAISAKADLYITGDIKYHDFFQAENRIILADIGHYESEQYTKEIFYKLVTKKISKFAVQFSKINTNPINYL